METVAVTMPKGGAGKTTTTINLCSNLARKGKRILLIDLDPQASLTLITGLTADARSGGSSYELLRDDSKSAMDLARRTSLAGLDVIPAHEGLAGAEVDLVHAIHREHKLQQKLAALPEGVYDYVFVDCRPSLGQLTINALTASKGILIPVKSDYLTYSKLPELWQTMQLVQGNTNASLGVWGVSILDYDEGALECRLVQPQIQKFFADVKEGDKVFKTVIRHSAMLGRAHIEHKDVETIAPKSIAAADYRALAQEVLNRAAQRTAA